MKDEGYDKKPPITGYNFYQFHNFLHPDSSIFCYWVRSRIRKNKNFICAIVGETGGGKSWSSLAIIEYLSTIMNVPFSIKDNYAWTPYEFMIRHNAGMPKGSSLCLDEGGTAINAKRFMSNVNIAIGNLVQTSRRYNYIYILNLPDIGFLDKTVRKLVHCIMEVKHIDYKNNRTLVIPKLLRYDRGDVDAKGDSKIYRMYLRVQKPHEPIRPVRALWVYKPSSELVVEYEQAKKDFTERLSRAVQDVVRDPTMDNIAASDKVSLSDVQAKLLYLHNVEKLCVEDVGVVLKMSGSTVRNQLKKLSEGGHAVLKFKKSERNNLDLDGVKERIRPINKDFFSDNE